MIYEEIRDDQFLSGGVGRCLLVIRDDTHQPSSAVVVVVVVVVIVRIVHIVIVISNDNDSNSNR